MRKTLKPKCDDCKAAYVGKYKNSCKDSNRKCLAHLPSGLDVDFDRYEHLILSEVKGSLPSESYYKKSGIVEPKYDKWLMKNVRERPDLIIR